MIIAKNQYGYNQEMFQICGMNALPFFAWSLGLLGVYFFFSHVENIVKLKGFIKKIGLFSLISTVLLIVVESIGYNWLNVHNIGTEIYAPLPLCNCMHAPVWMQISYFAMGPIYFAICYALNLEKVRKKSK